jgi:glucokinase
MQSQNSKIKKILAIDIGATFTRIGLVYDQEILRYSKIETPEANLSATIKKEINRFLEGDKISSLALSVAGPVVKGRVSFSNLPGFPELNISDFFDICSDVVMINDAAAGAFAEKIFGNENNFVYITFSTGIGVGIFIKEKLTEAELGHMVIESDFYLECGCGGTNHWEAYCGGKEVINFYLAYSKEQGKIPKKVSIAKEIFKLADLGDRAAEDFIINGFGRINNIAISNILAKYKPEKLIIGGSMALKNQALFLKGFTPEIRKLITFTELGDDNCLLGAASYAMNRTKVNETEYEVNTL